MTDKILMLILGVSIVTLILVIQIGEEHLSKSDVGFIVGFSTAVGLLVTYLKMKD